mmetsp:Transcript_24515/g.58165  ORF Transcript_24515/g.58165 Transcript_24515/m.58165 type:complete len:577 (+) Transcript_24515:284-2014(+)|eukprot:CAMPEP_0113454690 /NCGR_PEP_ID=MMETSP0014_2-20120614/7993_1 /TAXON_ID=2857 /ORGANISM="Nitzschia sp." /LENGTH=576 /DNA_ID=CAMNT_0000346103 /DNA_START=469 /DNA_END=2199 /DNA_ORIENTATION=- /assembly_acc=CAM_ASM_000159
MFRINEDEWGPKRNLDAEFGFLVERVNAINHGEFEKAVEMLLEEASRDDAHGEARCSTFALQRCRRGGKTFMLHNVASKLTQKIDDETHVIFISLNSTSRYIAGEDAYQAILGRIAWEYTGNYFTTSYDDFSEQHTDFREVNLWVRSNKVILVVDELNVITPDAPNYSKMSRFLDELVGRRGCSLIYSTHLRDTTDLLRDRLAGESASLSFRNHEWLMIPRIVNENCLRGLRNDWNTQPSFWCAVLRGRLPALLVQPQRHIELYGQDLFRNASVEERVAALAAVITGEIGSLPNTRNQFRAYSYMSERFTTHERTARFAWPPFLVSQWGVLGKECGSLRTNLEDPSIDEAKAFEALTQLAVLVRLLSAQHHELVPHNMNIPDGRSFEATEILHVAHSATTITGVIEAVRIEFSQRPDVLQVVAVPYYASFPMYDFFVLHRADDVRWRIAAGYQCKQGNEYPTGDASPDVPLSIWIEGKCRKYRIAEDGAHVQKTISLGWIILGESGQLSMLGVSVSEALPASSPASTDDHVQCSAEMVWAEKMEAAASSESSETRDDEQHEKPPAKKPRTEASTQG